MIKLWECNKQKRAGRFSRSERGREADYAETREKGVRVAVVSGMNVGIRKQPSCS